MSLSKSQIAHFNDYGYVVVRDVLDIEKDIDPVIDEYTVLFKQLLKEWGVVEYDENSLSNLQFEECVLEACKNQNFPRHLLTQLDITLPYTPLSVITKNSNMHLGKAVFSLLTSPRIINQIESLLGSEILVSPDQHYRAKLPHYLLQRERKLYFSARKGESLYTTTIWHQDMHTQMPQADETNIITVWVPTNDVSENDGCLLMVPGYHKNKKLLDFPIVGALKEKLEVEGIPLPVKKGDIVIFHKRTPHAALPNMSNKVRLSFDFRYYPADQVSTRPWFPSFLVKSNKGKVLNNYADWAAGWLEARDKLASIGYLIPGRREFALLALNGLIEQWES